MGNIIKQKTSLLMIVATLLVITITSALLWWNKSRTELEMIRADGATLTRILANLPYSQLSDQNLYGGPLQLLRLYLSQSALEYVVIEGLNGEVKNQLATPETLVPKTQAEKNSLWLTEQILNSDVKIIEYRAPLLNNGELVGYVRTGFRYPILEISTQQLSLIAQFALPIFLLMAFFYYLLKQQLKPVAAVNEKMNALLKDQNTSVEFNSTPELDRFMDNFNSFMQTLQSQSKELETIRVESQTSNNLLSYHKKRIEMALQKLPDALMVIDEDGYVTFANDKLDSSTGILREDIVGKAIHEWCDDDQLKTLLSQYNSKVTPIYRIETIQFNPTAFPQKTLNVSGYPLFSAKESSEVLGTLIVFRDITESVQASKSRDEFIGHVAHELKSPLNVIGMQSELIQDIGISDENQIIQSSNIILDEVERLSNLINDLLNITKIESGSIALNKQRVKIQDFLQDTFDSAMRYADTRDLSTEIHIDNNLSHLHLDKDLFRVALNNILSNAVKYNRDNGTVSMTAELLDDSVRIKIADTGFGIQKEDQEKIFEKFYRAHDAESKAINGHGLGLALAREIIMLHNGKIEVESEPGVGTAFIITIENKTTFLKQAM